MFNQSKGEVATSAPMMSCGQPLCAAGLGLIREFQVATEIRAASRDSLLLSSTTLRNECEEDLRLAKRKYNDTLVAWITHRAFCVACRITCADKDLIEFASF
jgi:hypothetical protein